MSNQPYDNTNTGALFRNERKETDRHPDHNGSAKVKCPHCGAVSEFWLAAWVKEAKAKGKRFFSLAFTGKDDRRQEDKYTRKQQEERNFNDFDDDTPF